MSETTIGDGPRPPVPRDRQAPVFAGRYLSITSFRRDGTGVATPVWFVEQGGRLLVQTDANSYKVRRIRRNPEIRVALCTAGGRLRSQPVTAHAELLTGSEVPAVERLIARKYRVDLLFIKAIWWMRRVLRVGRARTGMVALAIDPR